MRLVSVNLISEHNFNFLPLATVPLEFFDNELFVIEYLSSYFKCKIDNFNIIHPGKKLTYVGNDSLQYLVDANNKLHQIYLFNRSYVFYNHVVPEGVLVFSSDVNKQFSLTTKDLMVEI